MKDTLKKQKLFFISLIGLVVVSLVMGTTYAYQTLIMNETEEREVSIKSGVLDVKFERTNLINNTNMPLLPSYNYADYTEFTIDNTNSTEDVVFKISLSGIEYGYIDNSGTMVSGCRTATTSLQAACIIDENFKYTLVEIIDGNETLVIEGNFGDLATTEVELSNYINIAKGGTKIYRLYLWLNETQDNQNHLENTYFKGKLNVTSVFESSLPTLANAVINSAKNAKQEVNSLRTKFYDIHETLPSTPAEEVSGSDERVLAMAEDDYTNKILTNGKTGTYSYYFRGNVTDNYVNFANMCWRIVRIAGDGSVKLILEDQYTTCDDDETSETDTIKYTGNWILDPLPDSIKDTGNYGYTKRNVDSDSTSEFIMAYLKPYNDKDISMVKTFYDFQTTGNLKSYTDNLKVGDWCLANKAYRLTNSSGFYQYLPLDTYDYYPNMRYDSYIRLFGDDINGYQSTLKCNGIILNEFEDVSGVSSKSPMYVSAITADELVYAGGKVYNTNENFYLLNDFYVEEIHCFWSLSPFDFTEGGDHIFILCPNGFVDDNTPYGSSAFRPVISLKTGIEIESGGVGTIDKPYVIK